MKKIFRSQKGFTLIEILLVVAAIGILSSIVIVAINPSKQLGETRNAERKSDVSTIVSAVYQYTVDNGGAAPAAITAIPTEICGSATCTGLIDLGALTSNSKYLTTIPVEPQKANANGVGYMISKTIDGRITVSAQYAEQGATISVTR